MRHNFLAASLTSFTTAVLIAGCSGGSSSDSPTMGRISLGVSDGPIHEATKVCITFNEIEFRRSSDSTVVTLDPPVKVNLLDFQGANAAPLLINQELPAGNYQQMRLGIDAVRGSNGGLGDGGGDDCNADGSYIVLPTGPHNLYVPSGQQNGLRLVSGFTVPANGSADFTAEFDLMKSVTAPTGLEPDVILRPTIRLVNNVEVGTLTGVVSNELASANECEPSVFVFDEGVMPNPIDEEGAEDDPVATALVNFEDVQFEYVVGYLLAGNYNGAFTCDGETLEPENGKPVMIAAGQIAELPFP